MLKSFYVQDTTPCNWCLFRLCSAAPVVRRRILPIEGLQHTSLGYALTSGTPTANQRGKTLVLFREWKEKFLMVVVFIFWKISFDIISPKKKESPFHILRGICYASEFKIWNLPFLFYVWNELEPSIALQDEKQGIKKNRL